LIKIATIDNACSIVDDVESLAITTSNAIVILIRKIMKLFHLILEELNLKLLKLTIKN